MQRSHAYSHTHTRTRPFTLKSPIRNGIYQVLKTAGNPELGGNSFETRLMQVFAAEFHRKYKLNVTESKKAVHKLRAECERVVQVLSTSANTMASIDTLMEGVDLHLPIDRQQFNKYCADLFEAALAPVKSMVCDHLCVPVGAIVGALWGGGGGGAPPPF